MKICPTGSLFDTAIGSPLEPQAANRGSSRDQE